MTFDALACEIASHEAAHAVSAVLLGRELIHVKRSGNLCGETLSAAGNSKPGVGLVAVAAPWFVGPAYLCHLDFAALDDIAAKHNLNLTHVYRQAKDLTATQAFRRAWRAVEFELYSHQFLTGPEVELVIAWDRERESI